jgi:hypothetical protein
MDKPVLFCYDGSDGSRMALAAAAEWIRPADAAKAHERPSSVRSRPDRNHLDAVMTSHPNLGECSSGDWTPMTCGPS